ncbi:MAG TPA: P1 family peptidase [Spirochaetia bacterium]
MRNTITDVPGILVGHAQDEKAGTGCTVVLCESGAVAGVDVRGGAPGTRETDCLDPSNFVPAVHAIYLGGGSAFGLDGASGVMRYLEEKGIGLDVGVCRVPIVPGAVIFDLPVGDCRVRPSAQMGYDACRAAGAEVAQGNVGAGTGASVGKAAGLSRTMKGGLGTASIRSGDLIVGAIVAVNCYGDVLDAETGEILAGALTEDRSGFAVTTRLMSRSPDSVDPFSGNTTIGVVATNARLDKAQAERVAMMAHDGFARAIDPIHTMHDGDTIFALATGGVDADITVTGALAARVMAQAIASAVRHAKSAYGLPCHAELQTLIRRRQPPMAAE